MNRTELQFARLIGLCLILLLVNLILFGCSAPFDNPLDPRSDRYVPPVEPIAPPIFDFRVYSRHISYEFPSRDTYQVHTELSVASPLEIDTAFVRYQNDRYYSLSGSPQGIWGRSFTESFFGDTLFQKVLGNPFTFLAYVTDRPDSFLVGPGHVVRVIEPTPLVIVPARQETTNGNPTLRWDDFDSANQVIYPFAYFAEISNYELIVWESEFLSDTTLAVSVMDTLSDGDYYWTISVIDSFNNVSRSKEGRFAVAATLTP